MTTTTTTEIAASIDAMTGDQLNLLIKQAKQEIGLIEAQIAVWRAILTKRHREKTLAKIRDQPAIIPSQAVVDAQAENPVDTVMNVMRGSQDGLTVHNIEAETGLPIQKIRAAVMTLDSQGELFSVGPRYYLI